MTDQMIVFADDDDYFGMTKEEWDAAQKDHWSGLGHIEFFVIQNTPDDFEIDVIDYSGCVGGAHETLGVDYLIKDMWCLHEDPDLILREGVYYIIHDVTVTWTRGDGWTTDDDVDYDYKSITHHTNLWLYMSHKAKMIWWRRVGWRIAQWRQKRR